MSFTLTHTKYGTSYEIPNGLQEENYYEMMYDLINYVKEKGLTPRQTQKLFIDCSDMVLDEKLQKESSGADTLKSIAECLDKIARKVIDTFNPCTTTNC